MTDCVGQVGSVERVEMECLHTVVDKVHNLLRCYGGGNEMCRRRVVFQALKPAGQL